MASDAKLGVAIHPQVEPWDVVGSIKDVVLAFIELLVNPLLLSTVSNVSPSQDDHNSVAKQMHAVVLLYNYYHRKQNHELVFLDFLSFCKLAVLVKPTLVAFFNHNESKGLYIDEDQLSITGKAVKSACDIAASLDASRDVPNIQGWHISKVAVLLIDSKKENCLLQLDSVAKGIWSPIEKELTELSIKHEISAQQMIGHKRKLNLQKTSMDETHLLQLAYDAVKVAEGYNKSDLKLLETHVAYSLSKEKSTTRLYMMQYNGSFSIQKLISLKELVGSLQGPLAEKLPFACWGTKAVVEFHHMLPYLEFLECWLSRNGSDLSSLNGCNAPNPIISCKEELTESRTLTTGASENGRHKLDLTNGSSGAEATCVDNYKKSKLSRLVVARCPYNISPSTKQDDTVTDRLDKNHDVLDSSKNISGRNAETSANDSRENKGLSSRIPGTQPQKIMEHRDSVEEGCLVVDSVYQMGTQSNSEVLPFNGHPHPQEEGVEKLNQELDVLVSVKEEDLDVMKTGPDTEHTSTEVNSKIKVYHQRRKKNPSSERSTHAQDNFICLKVDVVDSSMSNQDQCRKEKSGKVIDDAVASNQDNHAATGKELLVQVEGDIDSIIEIEAERNSILDSEELQNALAILLRKRQQLNSEICILDDTLVLCEDNIERIRDGGEVGLARRCIKYISTGKVDQFLLEDGLQNKDNGEENPKSKDGKQTRLHAIYLPGKFPCKDLEYICMVNNWRVPRYHTEPSCGKFVSTVVVKGKDIELYSEGSLESKPSQARESAAGQMMAKLQSYDG